MSSSMWWGLGLGMAGAMALGFGCSSSSSSASTGTGGGNGGSGTTASTSDTTATNGTTASSTSATTGPTTSSTGSGGAPPYDCNSCLDPSPGQGAKAKECKTQGDACFQNKSCVEIYDCTFNGATDGNGNPVGPCTNSAEGACCTFLCYDLIKMINPNGAQAAIDAYEALDQCTTCGICKDLCSGTTEYCDKYAMGQASCP